MEQKTYFLVGPQRWQGELWKGEDETIDVTFDWSRRLNGETIASATWGVPANWTQPQPASLDTSSTKSIARLAAGSAGTMDVLINTVTTSSGRVLQAAAIVHVREALSV